MHDVTSAILSQGGQVARKIRSSRGPGNEATCSMHSMFLPTMHGIFLVHCAPSAIYSAVSAITLVVAWAANLEELVLWH